jgi:hypothetical protein
MLLHCRYTVVPLLFLCSLRSTLQRDTSRHTHTHTHTHTQAQTHTHTHIYIHTYTHIHTHVHAHIGREAEISSGGDFGPRSRYGAPTRTQDGIRRDEHGVCTLLIHCYFTGVTLLSHCCYTVVHRCTLLIHRCCTGPRFVLKMALGGISMGFAPFSITCYHSQLFSARYLHAYIHRNPNLPTLFASVDCTAACAQCTPALAK